MRLRARRALTAVLAGACLVLALVLALVSSGSPLPPDPSDPLARPDHVDGRRGGAADQPAGARPAGPRRPPVRVCGSADLRGPAAPPAGARRVATSHRLDRMVDDAPPGTTFWLEPGVHRLGTHPYDQVTPKARMTFVGGPGAVLDGQRRNRYAFGGHATGVTVEHLTVRGFGPRGSNHHEGVVNHDAGDGWRIRHNTVSDNAGAGVLIGSRNVVSHNCLRDNGQYGFSAYQPGGVRDVVLRRNEVVGNNTDGWERRVEQCGCSGGGKFWETRHARIVGNWIHDNHGVGLWADTNNTGFLVRGNHVTGNDSEGVIYETSYNARIVSNTFARNGHVDGPSDPGFPTAALYLSESGSDPRAGQRFGEVLVVAHNRFVDNWAGLMAWENADRFAGSPANTSTGATTLVAPRVATVAACADPELIATRPWYDDCRWKTQHLRVRHNVFRFAPARIGPACTPARSCGFVGLVSQWGSYPDWSPYRGTVVEEAITFHQDNRWRANRYRGPWRFQVLELGHVVGWSTWRQRPYRQDARSSLAR